jgi:alkylation response protein AidB-like acyl-CoA dehydrogenase
MDLTYSAEERAFQAEVRAFVENEFPAELKHKIANSEVVERDDYVKWHKILHAKGWVAPAWPTEIGGCGWNVMQRHIFSEELARVGAPRVMPFGVSMVGPVIANFGNAEQKAKYLPPILSCDDWWCQGYSEPGAGSDLASLSTKAVRDGDHYIVNGTKTWTSFAHYANKMFCLVRTDPEVKPQEGISFLLIDMEQPGVEVTPIVTLSGGNDVNTVFLTDVKVPVEDLVGEKIKGWTYAKFLLGNERFGIAGVAASKARVEKLKNIAETERQDGQRLIDDSAFSNKIADMETQLMALEYTERRYLMEVAGGGEVGAKPSLLKIRGTDIQQDVSEMLSQAVGYYAHPFTVSMTEKRSNLPPVGPRYAQSAALNYFDMRKTSIYGGSNEIQRGIMAKMVLGL